MEQKNTSKVMKTESENCHYWISLETWGFSRSSQLHDTKNNDKELKIMDDMKPQHVMVLGGTIFSLFKFKWFIHIH